MQRNVSTQLEFSTVPATSVAIAIGAAKNPGYDSFTESLNVVVNGVSTQAPELTEFHGGRFWTLDLADASRVTIDYTASIAGMAAPEPVNSMDLIRYVRPSRYCESDRLLPTSYAEFSGLDGIELLNGVRRWVNEQLSYVSGSSRPTDGSVQTLLARQGVCRDYAHLVISLLRAKDVPARLAAVYAPGLSPMDFHAVAEAYVEGAWFIVDATGLAPRSSMVRIATGRDGSDTAFLSTVGGRLHLERFMVGAVVDSLPMDDAVQLTELR